MTRRKRNEIMDDLMKVVTRMEEISVLSPEWDELVEKRNRLMVELEQEAHPVEYSKGEALKGIPKQNINQYRK